MNGIRKPVWVWTEWGIDRMGNELLASDRFEYIDTGMGGRWQKEIV